MGIPKPELANRIPEIAGNIEGMMKAEELVFLAEEASKVQSWTELGGFIGRSFFAVAMALPQGALLQVVDLGLGFYRRFGQSILTTYETIILHRPDLDICMMKMDSAKSAKYMRRTDVVFIDACHHYEFVKNDILAWKDKAKILMGHDYHPNHPGVVQAVNEVLGKPKKVVESVWYQPVG